MRYLWLAWLAVVFNGCIPYSDNPLTAPDNKCPDMQILGTWFVHDNGETVFLHIGMDEKTQGLHVVMVELQTDGEVKTSELAGHVSRLGDKTYMNLRWDQPAKQEAGYLFVKYMVAADRIGIGLIRSDAVEKAIREEKLRGEIVEGQWVSSVKIKDSSERLQAYFQQHDEELFEKMTFLSRLKVSEGSDAAMAAEETNKVLIRYKEQLSETVYFLGDASCEVNLTVYRSESNRGIVHVRSKCAGSWERKLFLFEKVLRKVLEDDKQADAFHTLFWGRLVPDPPEGPQELSYRLALAAFQSPLWDKKLGQAKKRHENGCVAELANRADIYRELRPIFAAFDRHIRFSSAEKVLITEAQKLPFFDALKNHGVQAEDRLPFDCLAWFSVSGKKE